MLMIRPMRPLATVALILAVVVSRTAYCLAITVTLAWDGSTGRAQHFNGFDSGSGARRSEP
jgi:Arc/MetJ family transcription regulator